MQITFEIAGATQLSRNLRLLASDLKGPALAQFHSEAADIIEEKSLKIFDDKGQNVEKSPKWAPLGNRTVKARERRWGYYRQSPVAINKPLVWTGTLRDSRRKTSNANYGMLEFTARYGLYHQRGGGTLPQRAILDLDNQTNSEIVRTLQKIINEKIGIYGLQA